MKNFSVRWSPATSNRIDAVLVSHGEVSNFVEDKCVCVKFMVSTSFAYVNPRGI